MPFGYRIWVAQRSCIEGRSMSVSYKSEMSVFDYEEREVIRSTHHPCIGDLDREALTDLRRQIRNLRDKEKVFVRHLQRESLGRAEGRGGSFPGTIGRPYQRKQAFSSALKRLNREIHRLEAFEARAALGESARRALRLKRSRQFIARPEDSSPNKGWTPLPSRRRARIVQGGRIGSVSQQGKRFQANKDAGA